MKFHMPLSFALFLLALFSCEKQEDDGVPAGYLLSITEPKNEAVLAGAVEVRLALISGFSPSLVTLYLDQQPIVLLDSAPWVYSWNTIDWVDGEHHHLWAHAEDGRGTEGESPRVLVTFAEGIPELLLSPLGIDLGEEGDHGHFLVRNSGEGLLEWSVGPLDPRITVDPESGSVEDQSQRVDVYFDRETLDSGPYEFLIPIQSNSGNGSVSLSAVEPAPLLLAEPLELVLVYTTPSELRIYNEGGGFLEWSLVPGEPWIMLERTSGILHSGWEGISVQLDLEQAVPGETSGSIQVLSNGGNASVTVLLQD